MTRFLFIMTLFILFIIEGTVVQVFAPDRWGLSIVMVPRFIVVILIISSLFLGRFQGLVLGFIFGLMYDVVYGNILGVYAFSMAFIGYFSGVTFRIFQHNIFLILTTVIVALFVHELIVYGILTLVNFVVMDFELFLMEKLIPTLVLNVIFALLVSFPLRTILVQMREEEEK